ncbi:MAG: hypothetical protein C0594_12745, partial [Marinilabiliales bacterium]
YRKRDILLGDDDLNYIQPFETRLVLEDDLNDFFNKCKAEINKKRKIVRNLTFVSVVVFVLVLGIVAWYMNKQMLHLEGKGHAIEALSQFNTVADKARLCNLASRLTDHGYVKGAQYQIFNEILCDSVNVDTFSMGIRKDFHKEIIWEGHNIYLYRHLSEGRIFAYSQDSTVSIWNNKQKKIIEYKINSAPLKKVVFSKDENLFAGWSIDTLLNIYNINGDSIASFKMESQSAFGQNLFDFIGSDKLAFLSDQNTLSIADLKKGNVQKITSDLSIQSIAASPDEKFICSANHDGSINVWYYNNVKEEFSDYNQFKLHTDTVWSVVFASNSRYILSVSASSEILFATINGEPYLKNWSFELNNRTLNLKKGCVKFTNNDKNIICTAYNYPDGEHKTAMHAFTGPPKDMIWAGSYWLFEDMVFSPDNNLFAVKIFNNNKYSLADGENFAPIMTIEGRLPQFTPNTEYLTTVVGNKIQYYYVNQKIIAERLSVIPTRLN